MKKPSVSDLLDLLAKPALIGWANKQGLQGIDISVKRKSALEKGTKIHSQVERYCNGEAHFDDPLHEKNFERFLIGREIESYETQIETDWFVGRYDAKLIEGKKKYIVDYKTGFKGKVYLEHKLQLIAYTMAEPAEMAIVSAPGFELFPIEIENRKPYEEILKHLSALWTLKKEIEK